MLNVTRPSSCGIAYGSNGEAVTVAKLSVSTEQSGYSNAFCLSTRCVKALNCSGGRKSASEKLSVEYIMSLRGVTGKNPSKESVRLQFCDVLGGSFF